MRSSSAICQFGAASATAILLASCVPGARPTGVVSEEQRAAREAAEAQRLQEDADDGTPAPPEREAFQLEPAHRATLDAGPQVCVVRRPDLQRAYLKWEPQRGDVRPEELYLLREYLTEAWQRQMPQGTDVVLQPLGCDDALLCASVPQVHVVDAAAAFARALSSRPQAAFYAVRPEVISQAEDWDRSSPDWKLGSRSMLLISYPPAVESLAVLSPPATARQWETALNKDSGAGHLNRAPLYALEKSLNALITRSQLTVAGSEAPAKLLATVQEQYTPRNKEALELADEWRSRALASPKLSAPIPMEDGAGYRSYAQLTWSLPADASLRDVEVALQLMVNRWTLEHESPTRVRVVPGVGLTPLPIIRIDGAHDSVLAALSELSVEHDRLISASSTPTTEQWEAALPTAPHPQTLDPRCASRSKPDPKAGIDALRKAGAPSALIWGTDAPETTSEDSPD